MTPEQRTDSDKDFNDLIKKIGGLLGVWSIERWKKDDIDHVIFHGLDEELEIIRRFK